MVSFFVLADQKSLKIGNISLEIKSVESFVFYPMKFL